MRRLREIASTASWRKRLRLRSQIASVEAADLNTDGSVEKIHYTCE
jgi:hypothetical protein